MRILIVALLLCLILPACAHPDPEPGQPGVLSIKTFEASGLPLEGVRLEPSWGSGTVSGKNGRAELTAGSGDLILRLEGGQIAVVPWNIPAVPANAEITIYPAKAASWEPLALSLPVQMGTGFVWQPLRSDSGCKPGNVTKPTGDQAGLAGGSGTQQIDCPPREPGSHAESFVLARHANDGGRTYPETQGRPLYRVAVFLLNVH